MSQAAFSFEDAAREASAAAAVPRSAWRQAYTEAATSTHRGAEPDGGFVASDDDARIAGRGPRHRAIGIALLAGAAALAVGGWLTAGPWAPVEPPRLMAEPRSSGARDPVGAPPAARSRAAPWSTTSPSPAAPREPVERRPRLVSADERGLLEVYDRLNAGDFDTALARARRLVEEVPNFGLAQLVYGDLLVAAAGEPAGFGAVPAEWGERARKRVEELAAEARARVKAATWTPPPGTVPTAFVSLAASVKYALAVDTTRSRVYVIENGPNGPFVLRDYYASIGKQGIAKFAAGDQRTPLGVYFVTRQVAAGQLNSRYGTRGFVLNYPNPYDRLVRRGGDGIWLHGIPTNEYSRPPLSTDGCVAMTNTYLEEVGAYIDPQGTPVVIAEQLEWATPSVLGRRHAPFVASFDAWRAAREIDDDAAVRAHYSTAVNVPEVPSMGTAWRRQLVDDKSRRRTIAAPTISRLSIVAWQEREFVMVVTFDETDTDGNDRRTRRQYWLKEKNDWRIFYERVLG